MDYVADLFTINMDLTNDFLSSTLFFITKTVPSFDGKVHIVNYSETNIKEYFTIDDSNCSEFIVNSKDIINKLYFVDEPIKSMKWIKDYISNLGSSDLLLIIGAEKLIDYKKANTILEKKFFDSTNAIHFLEGENWIALLTELDYIYGEYQNKVHGIFTNIRVDNGCVEIINNCLNDSKNMSIIITSDNYDHEQNYKLQKDLISKISALNLNDSINMLKELENKLSKREYNFYVAMAYYKSGDISKCISTLDEHYNSLLDEDKLILADMLITINNNDRAKEILDELYKKNKYLKNLFSSILRLNLNQDTFNSWLEIANKYDPDNPTVIELLASKLSSDQNYEEAAKVFRRLSSIMKASYYELVARMNDILANKFTKDTDKIYYINEHINLYPELRNEGYLRLANYFILGEHYNLAYQCLQKTLIGIDEPKSSEIIKLKIDILKDDMKISKALCKLKPFKKSEDAERIAEERTINIVEFIKIFASKKAGYLIWRDFLTCQDNNTWNKHAFECLRKKLGKMVSIDIESKINNSYLKFVGNQDIKELGNDIEGNPKQASINLIKLLRSVKNGDFKLSGFDTYEEFVKATCTLGEIFNDDYLRIISRYYVSIIASSQGKHQDANNYALSVLELYDMIADSYLKNLCLYLGLLSWGYSQYRIGRHTEGILCIISIIDFCTNSSEILPFLEEGLNIISRFIVDDEQEDFKKRFSEFNIITDTLGKYNINILNLKYLCANDDDIISELSIRIDKCEKTTVNWAGDVVNLIARYANKKLFDKSLELIIKHGNNAIRLLENRKDIRFEVLYNWSFVCFSNIKDINNIFLALKLIELSSEDIEEKRKVSHREERASIGAQAEKIYKLYIDICSILLNIISDENLKNVIVHKIEGILPKLSPRSIIEQKNYYNESILTDEVIKLENEYKLKIEEYKSIMITEENDVNLLSKKAEEAECLKQKLKECHPYYMELSEYDYLPFSEIQGLIEENEIVFQNLLTITGIVIIIISKHEIIFNHKYLNPDQFSMQELTQKFSEHMQLSNLTDIELENISNSISSVLGVELFKFIEKNKIKRIFNIPDFNLKMFSLLSFCIDKIFLIDKVDSIVNMIDYTSLTKFKRDNNISGVIAKIIGNSNDKNLSIIKKRLSQSNNDKIILDENNSDDLKNINKYFLTTNQFNTVAIFSHGVQDPTSNLLLGAKGIDGDNKIIRLDDIINDVLCFENLILISCSTGSPNTKQIEESHGTLSTLLEKFNGNMILCRWNVSTVETIDLLDYTFKQSFEQKLDLDKSLLSAQRYIKEKYPDNQYWSGIDFWIN